MFTYFISLLFCSALAFTAAAQTFPALTYSSFLRNNFTPRAIATDFAGNIYMTGGAILDESTAQSSVLLVKLNPQASGYVYVRYLGGSVNEFANAIFVDSGGNAYITGVTSSPDFPVTSGGNFGTVPSTGTERSFVAKFDARGELVFSDLLGGSANSVGQAIAVNDSGQVLVSGTSIASGFPSTPGAFSVSDTAFAPYLLELDPTGQKIVFSATGIGGSAIAVDRSGNIYVAGTTGSLTYPTTSGTYQPTFPVFQTCLAPCHGSFQGPNQYVTKVDPTGAKLIFSTAVSGTGSTLNQGLAVDTAGNVYLTGLAGTGYPFTVTPPKAPLGPALANLATPALPFLTKLDPAGQKLLYSVPVGGMGVQVDSNGFAYVGGILGLFSGFDVAAHLPALAKLPAECLPQELTRAQSAYAAKVDTSGNVLESQFIGGSTLAITGVALSGSTLWIAGPTTSADFPSSPNALTVSNVKPTSQPGAYLGAVDFSAPQAPTGTPQIGCILDSADLAQAGPLAPFQLLTIFGSGLGPTQAQTAPAGGSTTLGGVSVTIGSMTSPLLYVSENQINVAVPRIQVNPSGALMQVTVNGLSSRLQFGTTAANPSLFVIPGSYQSNSQEFVARALNADGSVNTPANPAQRGSVISVFVNGFSTDPGARLEPPLLYAAGRWAVTNYSQTNEFVLRVDLQVPLSPVDFNCQLPDATACAASFRVYDVASYLAALQPGSTGGLSFGGTVYVSR
jgi:uncharacterized protein (TIGR03437 family)